MIKDLEYLTGKETKGRLSGTEGARNAATYIAKELYSLGVQPAGEDGYYSYLDIFAARLHGKVEVSIGKRKLKHRIDFGEIPRYSNPTGNSVKGELQVVKDGEEVEYSLKGKVVLIPEKPEKLDLASTVKSAEEAGIVALLIESGEPRWFSKGLHGSMEESIPVFRVRKQVAQELENLQGEMVSIELPIQSDHQRCQNVLGLLQGKDSSKTLVISAHYDHLGDDHEGLRFPGAVDNASGVAIVLEMSRKLVHIELPFNVRFAFFTGEESGLLGAKHFINNSTKPISAVINVDSLGFEPLLNKMRNGHKEPGLWLADLSARIIQKHEVEVAWIYGGEDSVAFQSKGIPAIGLGQKPTDSSQRGIHTPDDKIEQLYLDPIKTALEIVNDIVMEVIEDPSKL
jgi:aminopeptidase YwaD